MEISNVTILTELPAQNTWVFSQCGGDSPRESNKRHRV